MMQSSQIAASQTERRHVTARWWFYVVLLFLFFLPSYASRPFDPATTPQFITAVLSQALATSVPAVYPLFKIIPLLLIAGIIVWGDRVTPFFNLYAALHLTALAALANMAITPEYGFGMITGNVVVYLVVAGFWLWEAVVRRNDFSPRPIPLWRYWAAPLAFLAFWLPAQMDASGVRVDFNPALIVTNGAGLALCMTIPVYLAALTIFYPTVNVITMRVTAFAAFITGLLNLIQWFGFQQNAWWMGALHLPMACIGLYAFGLSFRKGFARQSG